MKLTGFVANVMLALVLSLLGASLFMVFSVWLASWMALLVVFSVLAGSYLFWLLYSHRSRRGVTLVLLGWVGTGGLLLLIGSGALLALLSYSGLLWFTRSCLRYRQPLLALVDAGISLAAVALSIWVAQHTHSFALACWAYFLTQSMVFFVPGNRAVTDRESQPADRFSQARRDAELALERLQTKRV